MSDPIIADHKRTMRDGKGMWRNLLVGIEELVLARTPEKPQVIAVLPFFKVDYHQSLNHRFGQWSGSYTADKNHQEKHRRL